MPKLTRLTEVLHPLSEARRTDLREFLRKSTRTGRGSGPQAETALLLSITLHHSLAQRPN